MRLIPNSRWKGGNEKNLPEVTAQVSKDNSFLRVHFQVKEPKECYAAVVDHDGGHAWEDSCVEVFVRALDAQDEYLNFECTSKGFCYSARGKDRFQRTERTKEEYAQILRKASAPKFEGDFVFWELEISIPANLLGKATLENQEIYGNLYKCGDKSEHPHYLMAFPIETEKPDFHQPKFFQKLI